MENIDNNRIGLFFGSFNPIHIGHLIIANHMLESNNLLEVWFIVSPQNPFKEKTDLLPQNERLKLVKIAVKDNKKFKASNIEFKMPTPSYTIDTLNLLKSKHKNKDFVIIMGEDNLSNFSKWKNYQDILDEYKILVYVRENIEKGIFHNHNSIQFIKDVPQIDISSTFIRQRIASNKSIKYLLHHNVYKYIYNNNLYK